jgi:hypothetical protein
MKKTSANNPRKCGISPIGCGPQAGQVAQKTQVSHGDVILLPALAPVANMPLVWHSEASNMTLEFFKKGAINVLPAVSIQPFN